MSREIPPRRLIPETRFDPASHPDNDSAPKERVSHARLRTSSSQLASDARLSRARTQEAEDRRGILKKRIHDIQQEAGSLYAVMRACEEQVFHARFSADPRAGESVKIVEDDIRRFARSSEAPASLLEALSLPIIDERRKAVIEALRASLREHQQPEELRRRLERLWQRMDRASRSVTLAEAALLHAKREFLPYQRRIDELTKMIDSLDQERKAGDKEVATSLEALQLRQRLDSLPPLEAGEIDALEKAFHLYTVRGEITGWERLSSEYRPILQGYVNQFEEDPETTLDLLTANLRTDYEREELRIILTKFSRLLEDVSHASPQTPRHPNRRRPAANGS